MYLCSVKSKCIYSCSLFVAFLLLSACQNEVPVDPLRRSRVDGLNKEAFVNRYRDPQRCLALSDSALAYVRDSLPEYVDGELRARNNMAFAYFLTSDYPNANLMLDHVDKLVALRNPAMRNGDIELVIANLLRARLLQRNCQIADSYRLLYDIGRSGILEDNSDNLLYNYAQTEYYITLLTLNFHYRNGKEEDVMTTVAEVEARRPSLRVDYAQDMALNYALAYGLQTAGESLRALDYCDQNFEILDRASPGHAFCLYNYANTLQMTALIHKNMPGTVPPDSVLALYDEARECFFDYGDPYQMLGGVTSTARYALLIGDTLKAHQVLNEWRSLRGTWTPFAAPKMEVGYFDLLIRSGIARRPAENRLWYEHRCELQDYIARNEKEDFALQTTLAAAQSRSHTLTVFAFVLGGLILVLLVLTALLWRNGLRLRREKRQLQEAKRRDVERIANVETCLSVMRHDISPFIGYLRNPNLPADLRSEVLEQLLRTFDNIKNWTSLSIPTGLAFNATPSPCRRCWTTCAARSSPPPEGSPCASSPRRTASGPTACWSPSSCATSSTTPSSTPPPAASWSSAPPERPGGHGAHHRARHRQRHGRRPGGEPLPCRPHPARRQRARLRPHPLPLHHQEARRPHAPRLQALGREHPRPRHHDARAAGRT